MHSNLSKRNLLCEEITAGNKVKTDDKKKEQREAPPKKNAEM